MAQTNESWRRRIGDVKQRIKNEAIHARQRPNETIANQPSHSFAAHKFVTPRVSADARRQIASASYPFITPRVSADAAASNHQLARQASYQFIYRGISADRCDFLQAKPGACNRVHLRHILQQMRRAAMPFQSLQCRSAEAAIPTIFGRGSMHHQPNAKL